MKGRCLRLLAFLAGCPCLRLRLLLRLSDRHHLSKVVFKWRHAPLGWCSPHGPGPAGPLRAGPCAAQPIPRRSTALYSAGQLKAGQRPSAALASPGVAPVPRLCRLPASSVVMASSIVTASRPSRPRSLRHRRRRALLAVLSSPCSSRRSRPSPCFTSRLATSLRRGPSPSPACSLESPTHEGGRMPSGVPCPHTWTCPTHAIRAPTPTDHISCWAAIPIAVPPVPLIYFQKNHIPSNRRHVLLFSLVAEERPCPCPSQEATSLASWVRTLTLAPSSPPLSPGTAASRRNQSRRRHAVINHGGVTP